MPPTMSKHAPRPSAKPEEKSRIGTNNNISDICISDEIDDPKDKYPGEDDIVRFWSSCSLQSCGTNLLRLVCKNKFTLPSTGVKCYPVDFKGSVYCEDPKEDLKSELRWVPCDSISDGVHLYMHDPANLNKDTFPYVLGTTQYKDRVIPCAVPEQYKDSTFFSTIFEIKHISWGESWMFTINDVQPLIDGKRNKGGESMSPYYIGRSPNGDAIRILAHRQPTLLNPLTLMFMSDHGLRKPVSVRPY